MPTVVYKQLYISVRFGGINTIVFISSIYISFLPEFIHSRIINKINTKCNRIISLIVLVFLTLTWTSPRRDRQNKKMKKYFYKRKGAKIAKIRRVYQKTFPKKCLS